MALSSDIDIFSDKTTLPTTLPTTVPTTLPPQSSTTNCTLNNDCTTLPPTLPTTVPTTVPMTVPTTLPTTVPTTLPNDATDTTLPPTTLPTTLPTVSTSTPHPSTTQRQDVIIKACKNDNDGIIFVLEGTDDKITVVSDTERNKDNVLEINCRTTLPPTVPTGQTTLPPTGEWSRSIEAKDKMCTTWVHNCSHKLD